MITKAVLLSCTPARAFALFTREIDRWWPADRRHSRDPKSTIVLEEGGRLFERDRSGNEIELGLVRAWEPPVRLQLDWYPGTDPEHPTNVVVTFVPEGGKTRVQVEHGPTPSSEHLFPSRAPRYEVAWGFVLAGLAASEDAAALD